MNTTETKAAAAYRQQFTKAMQLLDEIDAALVAHWPGESVNYGHVGDLQHATARLQELLAHLRGQDIDA